MHMCVCCDCARGSFTFTFYHSFSWCYFSITVLFSFLSLPSSSSLSVLSSPVHTHTHIFSLSLTGFSYNTHTLSLPLWILATHTRTHFYTLSRERSKISWKDHPIFGAPEKVEFRVTWIAEQRQRRFRARAPFIGGTPPPLKKRSAIFRYVENFPTTKTREIQLLDWPLRRHFFCAEICLQV